MSFKPLGLSEKCCWAFVDKFFLSFIELLTYTLFTSVTQGS